MRENLGELPYSLIFIHPRTRALLQKMVWLTERKSGPYQNRQLKGSYFKLQYKIIFV